MKELCGEWLMLIWKHNCNSRRRNAYEAKQVGVLYHVCSADDLMNYIKPEDTLSTSGTYTNFLYGGNDWISFTISEPQAHGL